MGSVMLFLHEDLTKIKLQFVERKNFIIAPFDETSSFK